MHLSNSTFHTQFKKQSMKSGEKRKKYDCIWYKHIDTVNSDIEYSLI